MLRAALLALPLLARAHVSLKHDLGTPGPIRNANGPTADGAASVNGACSTNGAWGQNGNGELFDGATVTLKINYAAGHPSQANRFRMAYACGAPNANTMAGANAVLTSTEHSCTAKADGATASYDDDGVNGGVSAPEGIVPGGYVITCILPSMNVVEGQPKECTVALIDQRDWGGCVDVQVKATPAVFPPSPPPAPLVDNQGTYQLSSSDMIDSSADSFTCCAMEGTLEVPDYPAGSNLLSADLKVSASGCRETVARDAATTKTYETDQIVDMTKSFGSKYEGVATVAGQPFSVVVADGTVQLSNVGTEDPIVCDLATSGQALSIGGSSGNNSGVVAGAVIGTLAGLCLLGVGYWYCCKRQKGDPSATYNTEMAKAPPGAGLPAGWTSAQDPKSGATYYVCQATGQSTWTQPGYA